MLDPSKFIITVDGVKVPNTKLINKSPDDYSYYIVRRMFPGLKGAAWLVSNDEFESSINRMRHGIQDPR